MLRLAAVVVLMCTMALRVPEQAAAQTTPAAIITAVDEAGAVVTGACFTYFRAGDDVRMGADVWSCDREDGTNDGSTTIEGDGRFGEYIAYQTAAAEGYMIGDRATFTYREEGTDHIQMIQHTGGEPFTVTALSDAGNGVAGVCLYLDRDNGIGMSGQPVGRSCTPNGSTAGVVRFTGVPAGDYILRAPSTADFRPVKPSTLVTVEAGKNSGVSLPFVAQFTGSISVRLVDETGAAVLDDVCLEAVQTNGDKTGHSAACDGSDDGSTTPDGAVRLAWLPDGTYAVRPRALPGGFLVSPGDVLRVDLEHGAAARVTLELERGGQSLTILSPKNPEAATADAGCFTVYEETKGFSFGNWSATDCLRLQPDDMESTTVSVPAGNLVIWQTAATTGNARVPDGMITVAKDEEATFVVESTPEAEIEIAVVDQAGNTVKGGCFAAYARIEGHQDGKSRPFGDKLPAACDVDDGFADGTTVIAGLPEADYRVVPASMPASDELPVPSTITAHTGERARMRLQAAQGGGGITVIVNDLLADPKLPSRCFAVFTDVAGEPGELVAQRCDAYDGNIDHQLTIVGLPSGRYFLTLDRGGSIVPLPDVPPSPPVVVVDGATTAIELHIP